MAEKRMFAKRIIDSGNFLTMPLSAQALYFHLNMRADDDGFLDNAQQVQQYVRASEDDLKILLAKGYLIPFDSGVVVIRHWRIHNYIRKDTYHETFYSEEKSMLVEKPMKPYELKDFPDPSTTRPRPVDVDKISIDKNRLDKSRVEEDAEPTIDEQITLTIEAWNANKNIKATIDKIPFGMRRYNNMMLCIAQFGWDTFIEEIRSLDANGFFAEWKPGFDWVVDPNNFMKISDGNYKHNDKQTGDASKEWLEKWVAEDDEE